MRAKAAGTERANKSCGLRARAQLVTHAFFEQGTTCLCQAEYPVLISRWDPAAVLLPEFETYFFTKLKNTRGYSKDIPGRACLGMTPE